MDKALLYKVLVLYFELWLKPATLGFWQKHTVWRYSYISSTDIKYLDFLLIQAENKSTLVYQKHFISHK